MSCAVYVGTSGYSYADWIGPVYPQGTDRSKLLTLYSKQFSAVELNFSYYRQPEPKMIGEMVDRTPPGFLFSVKAHKSLTHIVTPQWPDEAAVFREGIAPLRSSGRLAAVLLQFPFSFHYTKGNRLYLRELCDSFEGAPLAVEFRNSEWHSDRVIGALENRSITYVVADYPKIDGLPTARAIATAPLGYIRFHGRNDRTWWTGTNTTRYDYLYSDTEIDEWIERIRAIAAKTPVLFAMFNNHWRGQAVENAVLLKKKLEACFDLELPAPHPD